MIRRRRIDYPVTSGEPTASESAQSCCALQRSERSECLTTAGLERVDIGVGSRDTRSVLLPGASRKRIARTLNAAYADGLLSEETLAHRLDQQLESRLIDPFRLIGDLTFRSPSSPGRLVKRAHALAAAVRRAPGPRAEEVVEAMLLALDWSGGQRELIVGRSRSCDVVLPGPGVSRWHARLCFRDGTWVVQDLRSTNGTTVNGTSVGRCALRPGDQLSLGDEWLTID
jgi:hypothetical protein